MLRLVTQKIYEEDVERGKKLPGEHAVGSQQMVKWAVEPNKQARKLSYFSMILIEAFSH